MLLLLLFFVFFSFFVAWCLRYVSVRLVLASKITADLQLFLFVVWKLFCLVFIFFSFLFSFFFFFFCFWLFYWFGWAGRCSRQRGRQQGARCKTDPAASSASATSCRPVGVHAGLPLIPHWISFFKISVCDFIGYQYLAYCYAFTHVLLCMKYVCMCSQKICDCVKFVQNCNYC